LLFAFSRPSVISFIVIVEGFCVWDWAAISRFSWSTERDPNCKDEPCSESNEI
jgi:hypothetical protein